MDVKTNPVFVTVQSLLKADRANPAGVSLEDSGALDALQNLARAVPASEVAGKTVGGRTPDWVAVEERARELLEQSIDARVLVVLADAALRTQEANALRAFAECVGALADLVENHWDVWFPNERVNGEIDTEFRANAISDLKSDQVIAGVRAVRPFRYARWRAITLVDLLRKSDGSLPDLHAIQGLLSDPDAAQDAARVLGDIRVCLHQLGRLSTALAARFAHVDFGRLSATLSDAATRMAAVSGSTYAAASNSVTEAGAGADVVVTQTPTTDGKLAFSRETAKNVLQQMIDHFVRVEPSSPVPLYLKRAQALIGLEFSEVVRQMGDDVKKFSET